MQIFVCWKLISFGRGCKLQKGISHYLYRNIVTLLKNHKTKLPLSDESVSTAQDVVPQKYSFKTTKRG